MGFEPIVKHVALSIDNPSLSQHTEIKQGFIGTFKIVVTLINNKQVFTIPAGTTAKARMLKPDKRKILNDFEIVGNTVVITFTYQMQAAPGDGSFEVILFNEGNTLTSSTCNITIVKNVHDDSGIESTDEYISVINALANVDAAIAEASQATENANAAKDLILSETLVIYKPYVDTYTDIATTYPNPVKGWQTQAKDTGIKWRYNGTTWTNNGVDPDDKVGDLSTSTNANKGNVIEITNELNANKLDKTGDSKDNTITFTQASTDAPLTSGTTHSILFGLIKKKLADILTSLAGKINTTDITGQSTTNDANKVPSSQVTYAQGQAINTINNNLVYVPLTAFDVSSVLSGYSSLTAYKEYGTVTINLFGASLKTELAAWGELIICNLPLWLRPRITLYHALSSDNNGASVMLKIETNGNVSIASRQSTSVATTTVFMGSVSYAY